MNIHKCWLIIPILLVLLAGCQSAGEEPSTGLANPASVYCADAGYTEETRSDANGEYGVCIFPDGTECESWAFFRGECGLDKTYCAQQGGTPEVRNAVLVCVFSDGTSCPEAEYAAGTCQPGS